MKTIDVDFNDLFGGRVFLDTMRAGGFAEAELVSMQLALRIVSAVLGASDEEALDACSEEGLARFAGALHGGGATDGLSAILVLVRDGFATGYETLGPRRFRLRLNPTMAFVLSQRGKPVGSC